MTVIEQMARAIYERRYAIPHWHELNAAQQTAFTADARASLGALRNLNPDIIWAACGDTDPTVAAALVERVLDQIEDEGK